MLAALASVGLGAVVGPEAPLIALGGGLAYLAVRLAGRDLPPRAVAVVAATGSFAAISTLLGSPLAGAFLLLEASAVGGALATAVLLPGLLSAGIGALVFTGLDSLTGYGTFSLAVPNLPPAGTPTVTEFGWAIVVGLAAGPLSVALRRLAVTVRDRAVIHPVPATVLLGLVIAGLAIGYAEATGHADSDVLFSGQSALPHCSPTAAPTPSAPSCCSCCARGSPTALRWPGSAAARPSRPCSSAPPGASRSPTWPGWR